MAIENVETLIGALGFPIVFCLLLFYERLKTTNELTKAINGLTELVKMLKTVIENKD
jgi:hypothetical protein